MTIPFRRQGGKMNQQQTFPLSESSFYVLYALRQERHGYDIIKWTQEITGGEYKISVGTVYNILIRMEDQGWIYSTRKEERRIYYRLTDLGESVLQAEIKIIKRLYQNSCGLTYCTAAADR